MYVAQVVVRAVSPTPLLYKQVQALIGKWMPVK